MIKKQLTIRKIKKTADRGNRVLPEREKKQKMKTKQSNERIQSNDER